MTHAGYIASAWGLTAVALAALLAWLIADGQRQVRRLADLEARGVKRRSAR